LTYFLSICDLSYFIDDTTAHNYQLE